MQNYFETDYVTINYDSANQLLVHRWIVAPTSDEYKEGLNSLIRAMEHFNTGKFISDTTHLGIIHPADQEWSATVWKANAVKAGYSHLALIIPPDIFTQMSMEDTMSQVANPFPFAYFNNLEAAIDWLNSFKN